MATDLKTNRSAIAARPPYARGWLVAAVPWLWLGCFFLVPFAIVFRLSLSDQATAQPPYRPIFGWEDGWTGLLDGLAQLDLDNYRFLASDDLYIAALLGSLRIAALATTLLLLIGFPIALAIARARQPLRGIFVLLVILPFWTSFLIRVYAWIGILRPEGLFNAALQWLGLTSEPVLFLNTEGAILLGCVYAYLPFMVLPVYAALDRQDPRLVEAAQDLGASPLRAFWLVTVPLAWPGIAAGMLLCFIPITGEVIIPDLLGGADTLMIGRTLWSEFFSNRDWPLASAVAVVMLILLVGPILLYRRVEARRQEAAT